MPDIAYTYRTEFVRLNGKLQRLQIRTSETETAIFIDQQWMTICCHPAAIDEVLLPHGTIPIAGFRKEVFSGVEWDVYTLDLRCG